MPDDPLPVRILREAATTLGWRTRVLDPEFGYLWELELPDGTRRAIVGGRLPLDDAAAVRIADDKFFCGLELERAGVRTPRTARCLDAAGYTLEDFADRAGAGPGLALARELGYPLVVKPNSLSHGRLVRVVRDDAALAEAVRTVHAQDRIALVQELVPGRELRLHVLDGEVLLAYERSGIALEGDGERTLAELLAAADPRYADGPALARVLASETFAERATARGLGRDSVLPTGEAVDLDPGVRNLNWLCTARLVESLDARWHAFAARVGEALHLRQLGIDLRGAGPGDDPSTAAVIEVNASPVLAQAYALGARDATVAAHARALRALAEPPRRATER